MEPSDLSPPEPGPIEPRPREPVFELSRTDFTFADLLSRASEVWSRDLAAWVLAMLLYFVIGIGMPAALGLLGGLSSSGEHQALEWLSTIFDVLSQLLQLVLSAIFTLGFWAMALRGLHGKRVGVGVLFSQVSKVWKYLLQWLAITGGLLLLVGPVLVILFLAFVGPVDRSTPMSEIMRDVGTPLAITFAVLAPLYVYVTLGILFMQVELAFNDDAGPIESIVNSWHIARGKRWISLGVALVAGLITLGSMMLCGIGIVFGAPFSTVLLAALYLALRTGADVPRADSTSVLAPR